MAGSIIKLPSQDDFLLSLHNNNYSIQTVINYARDLSIFALFLQNHKITFAKLSKQDIDVYKGYLRNCDHLVDLANMRKRLVATVQNTTTSPDAPNLNDDQQKVSLDVLKEIYKKVYTGKSADFRHQADHELDAKSANRMLSAIRSYLRYLIEMDQPYPLAPDSIKMIKSPKKKKQLADFDDIVKLIEFPTQFEKDKRVGMRNRAMLEMLFASGMRISELMSLSISDVNVEGKLFITGKGRKQRFVYLTPRALRWLDLYLIVRFKWEIKGSESLSHETNDRLLVKHKKVIKMIEDSLSNLADDYDGGHLSVLALVENIRREDLVDALHSPALFIPFSGRGIFSKDRIDKKASKNNSNDSEKMANIGLSYKFKPCKLSTNYFQEKIAQYRRRVGILVPTSAHSLRHGFATFLAENGASPVALQVLLGHESLDTTTRYVHASDKLAEGVHRQKHPLN